jgi:hypothetical protein
VREKRSWKKSRSLNDSPFSKSNALAWRQVFQVFQQ